MGAVPAAGSKNSAEPLGQATRVGGTKYMTGLVQTHCASALRPGAAQAAQPSASTQEIRPSPATRRSSHEREGRERIAGLPPSRFVTRSTRQQARTGEGRLFAQHPANQTAM